MDELIYKDGHLTDSPPLNSQIENEHHRGCCADSSAKQLGQESISQMTYQELLQQYTILSSQNAELAKEYLKLEQEYIVLEREHTVFREREQELERQLTQSQAILSGVLSSFSWRVTAPIRKFMERLRRRR